jgi:hypothetical protein
LHFLIDFAEAPLKLVFLFVLGEFWMQLFEQTLVDVTEAGFNGGQLGSFSGEEFEGRKQDARVVQGNYRNDFLLFGILD